MVELSSLLPFQTSPPFGALLPKNLGGDLIFISVLVPALVGQIVEIKARSYSFFPYFISLLLDAFFSQRQRR